MRSLRPLWMLGLIASLALGAWMLLGGAGSIAPESADMRDAVGATDPSGPERSVGIDIDEAERATREGADSRVAIDTPDVGSSDTPGPAIVGRIVDQAGRAVVGAEITALPNAEFDYSEPDAFDPERAAARSREILKHVTRVKTGEDGAFRLVVGGKGKQVSMFVLARWSQRLMRSAKRPIDVDVDLGVITLEVGAVVRGKVVDRSGLPIADARVGVSPSRSFPVFDFAEDTDPDSSAIQELWSGEVVTDEDGRFECPGASIGAIDVIARHVDHLRARLTGLEAEGGATLDGLVVVMDPGASISGRVTGVPTDVTGLRVVAAAKRAPEDKIGGRVILGGQMDSFPVSNGWSMARRIVRVAADGSFVVRGLQPGTVHEVVALQRGSRFDREGNCSQRVDVMPGVSNLLLPYEGGITVAVQVVDDVTGKPLESLWIEDSLKGTGNRGPWMGPPAKSRPAEYPGGRVVVANLRPDKDQKLTLGIEALGYSSYSREGIELPTTGTLDLGVVRLTPQPVLRVIVRELGTGQPVEGASVSLSKFNEAHQGAAREAVLDDFAQRARQVRTDEDGIAVLNTFSGAKGNLSVSHEGFAKFVGDPIEMPTKSDAEHVVNLGHGATIEIRTFDSEGAVIANAQIECRSLGGARTWRRSDEKGVTVFENLLAGTHTIRIRRNNADEAAFERIASDKDSVDPANRELRRVEVAEGDRLTVELFKNPVARLTGIVRENGKPLERATVAVMRREITTKTDKQGQSKASIKLDDVGTSRTQADGKFTIDDLPVGDFLLRISHPSRAMPTEVQTNLRLGVNTSNVDLETTIIRGIVRGTDGKPIAGASMAAQADRPSFPDSADSASSIMIGPDGSLSVGRGGRFMSKDDGTYELRGVEPGVDLVISAISTGYLPAKSAPVRVAPGQTREGVDLLAPLAGTVVVRIGGEQNFARVVAELQNSDDKEGSRQTATSRAGTATLDRLRAGTWKLTISRRGGEAVTREVEVVAGQTITIDC